MLDGLSSAILIMPRYISFVFILDTNDLKYTDFCFNADLRIK